MARLLYHRPREARGLVHPAAGAFAGVSDGAGRLSGARHPDGDRHVAGRPPSSAARRGGPARATAGSLASARARPRPLAYGSAGFGSPPHLSMELFAQAAGLKMVHVPYKGVGGAMPDLLAGRVQAMSMALGSARAYLKNGQLRPLATGAKRRIAGLPDLPTSAQAGP